MALWLQASAARATTRTVGPNGAYARPCQAIAAAFAGDVIEIDAAGSYAGDTCAWSTDGLIVRGVNGRAKIDITGVTPAQQKGLFTIAAANATLENLELSGAAIDPAAGNNGAAIRHQGLNLTVRNCWLHDNQDGILGAPSQAGQGAVLIENSELSRNGAGDGFSHNLYLGNYASFTLRGSYSHHANVGHLVKSRAYLNVIAYNRITDQDGTASYEIDLPNGGRSVILGNLIEQGAATQNPAIVSYAEEGVPAGYDTALFVVNNTFLDDRAAGGTYVVDRATTPALIQNDIFAGPGTITSQAGATLVANFDGTAGADPLFVDRANYDVHLASGSPCIDQGQLPGMSGGMSLTPVQQYLHPLSSEPRAVSGAAIDQGAFEFVAPSGADGGSSDAGNNDAGNSDAGNSDAGNNDAGKSGSTAPPTSGGCSPAAGGAAPLLLLGLAPLWLSRRRRRLTS